MTDPLVPIEEVSPAEAAQGMQAAGCRLPDPILAESRKPEAESRLRRFPISFQLDGKDWVAGQTTLFDLEPLRLVVCEPSQDCVLILRYGDADYRFDQWHEPPDQAVHSRTLSLPPPYGPLLWRPGELARIEVIAGTISGAAFVTRKVGLP